jgi:L-asparaginase II
MNRGNGLVQVTRGALDESQHRVHAGNIGVATDGCGLPTFALPLETVAIVGELRARLSLH